MTTRDRARMMIRDYGIAMLPEEMEAYKAAQEEYKKTGIRPDMSEWPRLGWKKLAAVWPMTAKHIDDEKQPGTKRCAFCGYPANSGMTDDESSFFTHGEECFERYMDQKYGTHCWMILGGDAKDEFGGYYLVADGKEECGFSGTGIYWTEFDAENE